MEYVSQTLEMQQPGDYRPNLGIDDNLNRVHQWKDFLDKVD
jgi:hypothetical protein